MTRILNQKRAVAAGWLVAVVVGWAGGCPDRLLAGPLVVEPAQVVLRGPEASQQLVVTRFRAGVTRDRTRACRYEVADPSVAAVTAQGRLLPLAEGRTLLRIIDGDDRAEVSVEVLQLEQPRPVSFAHRVLPILTKAGCNSGGCHGKAEGQNGFKLSIFGFDAAADYDALVKEARGRRITPATPDFSLLLRKATGELPHGGGRRIEPGSVWYRLVQRWIAEGAQTRQEAARLVSIEVQPSQLTLAPDSTQQLRVTATDSDGTQRCVTAEAEFQSNAGEVAEVDAAGLVTVSDVPGEAAILVRYMGEVAVCRVTLPQAATGDPWRRPSENNFIDRLTWDKLEGLGIQPSGLADDSTFLRRAYLDVIGTLPTAEATRRFLADNHSDKRTRLIASLLERPEYADYWAMKWADILRVDQAIVTPQAAVGMTRWLRTQFQQNTPYDQFVRELVTARGSTLAESPAAFYQVHSDPEMLGRSVSQLFLGVRIECAQCHHHPFERWSQQDYFAFAGFFTGVQRKKFPGGGQKIVDGPGRELAHPRTGLPVAPAGLGAAPLNPAAADAAADGRPFPRRQELARWLTAADNPYFARMIANRLWAHYLGRGLVDPVDDLRATNPAVNPPLLDALAAHLVEVNFDLKQFTQTLLSSRVYQLDWRTNASNQRDGQNFSHAAFRPVPAEVLLDAICQVTEIPEPFVGWPLGYRAIEVWDNRLPSYFFRVFGRPQRVSVCECERGNEPSIAQALHLMNSPETVRKIRHRDGLAARLAATNQTPSEIVETLYLTALNRFPSQEEAALMESAFAGEVSRREATEDVLWALINTREFVYNH